MPVADAQHDVDRAGEVAAQRLVAEDRVVEDVGEGQDRVVRGQVRPHERRQVAEDGLVVARPGRRVASAERQLEVHLAQPVTGADITQRHPRRERPERGVDDLDERVGEGIAVEVGHGPRDDLLLDVRVQLGPQVARLRIGLLEHRVHE